MSAFSPFCCYARSLIAYVGLSIASSALFSQTVPAPPPTTASTSTKTDGKDEVLELSPFVVNSDQETGWVATHSLAGSRLNTSLKDIAAPIEVLTKDFMDDFGLTSIGDAAIYTTNVEGVGDNLELGPGLGFGSGYPPPTRIRGLGNGNSSSNFFGVALPSDNYNVDRVTIASGPNNLLFGMGDPAGVIDVTPKDAQFKNTNRVDLMFDSNGSQRYALDLNREVVKRKLAARFSYLHEEKNYAYKPSGTDQTRLYGVFSYRPFAKTMVSLRHEDAVVHNIRPTLLLPFDEITPWYGASKVPGYVHTADRPDYANPAFPGAFNANSLNNTVFSRETNSPIMMIGPNVQGYTTGSFYNVNNTVTIKSPRLLPRVNGLNNEADGYTLLDGALLPTDIEVGGLSKLERVHSRVSSFTVRQEFLPNLHLEIAGQKQNNESWNAGMMSYTEAYTIQLDPNRFLTDGTTLNPNFGKKYVQGGGNGPFRAQTLTKTMDWRASLSYELDLERQRGSWWRKIAGRHRFNGLVSRNDRDIRQMELFARLMPEGGLGGRDPVLTGFTLRQPYSATGVPQNGWATDSSRNFQYRYYLGDGDYSPRPNFDLFGPIQFTDSTGRVSTVDMLNTGLKDQWGRRLGAGRENTMLKSKLETVQFSYQGFFWDSRAVVTFGRRQDATNRATVQNGYTPDPFTGLQPLIQDIVFNPYDDSREQKRPTTTRGIIVRPLHNFIKLPFGAEIALGYNRSDTFQANVSNFNPWNEAYPGASGTGEDKSIRLGLFDGRFNLRLTQFDNTAGPQRAGNVPYNRFRFTLSGFISRVNNLAFGSGNVSIDPAYPSMFPALGTGDPYWVTSFTHSTGKEINLDWQVTKRFQVRFNLNKQESKESDIGTDWWRWIDTYLPKYKALTFPEGGVANPRDLNGNGKIDTWNWDTAWIADNNQQTLAANYLQSVVQGSTGINIIQALDGKANEFSRNNRYNVNWVYRFDSGRLQGLSVGGAYRHRAKPLLSYGKTVVNGLDSFDLTKPFFGKGDDLWDLSINYRGKAQVWRAKTYRIGLNIRNLFNDEELYGKLLNVEGQPIRMGRVSEPRVFLLSVSFDL